MSKKTLTFTPSRLLKAIEVADLTYAEAGEVMGLSANSIAKYISGEATPKLKLAAVEKFINTGKGSKAPTKVNGKSKPTVNGKGTRPPNPRREFLAEISDRARRFYEAQARADAAKLVAAVERSLS